MSAALLRLEGVHTYIGGYHILQGVTLDVPVGAITLLLGRNGAGKTTTLRTIMGLWPAAGGNVIFDGQDITHLETPSIARRGIAYVPEDMGIFSDLTVAENMTLAARSARRFDAERLDWILALFPALKRFWHTPAGLLSGGQKQMLALGRAMIEPCKLLLVDEPSKGLAPSVLHELSRAFEEMKRGGTTILLVEQNFSFASRLGDSVAVIDDGRTVHTGSLRNLLQDTQMQKKLLGLSMDSRATEWVAKEGT